jgi:hypothetical protein
MSERKKRVRGVQNIRTLLGRVDQTFQPHRAFLRIACLEMEKARRSQEKEGAMRRVRSVEARCREIETEKRRLLEALGERDPEKKGGADGQGRSAGGSGSDTGAFKIKY